MLHEGDKPLSINARASMMMPQGAQNAGMGQQGYTVEQSRAIRACLAKKFPRMSARRTPFSSRRRCARSSGLEAIVQCDQVADISAPCAAPFADGWPDEFRNTLFVPSSLSSVECRNGPLCCCQQEEGVTVDSAAGATTHSGPSVARSLCIMPKLPR